MGSLMRRSQEVERNKRYLTIGVSSVGLAVALFGSTTLGILTLVAGGYLGWNWLRYRAKNGMRF